MISTKITFAHSGSNSFFDELKEKVEDYFKSNQLSRHANAAVVIKSIVLLTLMFVPYGLILSNAFSPGVMLVLAVVMGVGFAGVGFSIVHDALHGAYSRKAWINETLGLLFELLGSSVYLWKLTHNQIHHTYTNIFGADEDLSPSPIVRLSPHAAHKPIHRFQHRYVLLGLSTVTLYWAFGLNSRYLRQRQIGPYENFRHKRNDVRKMRLGKLVYFSYLVLIPLLVVQVAWWQFLIGFIALHVTASVIFGVIFQLAHVVEGPSHPLPNAQGVIHQAWAVHQLETTSNFAHGNALLSWYIGGLNYQIEHHLFPGVCSVHYPALSKIVRAVAAKHQLPYHYQPTLRAAVSLLYRTLKQRGESR